MVSNNFFSALDDSDDEAEAPTVVGNENKVVVNVIPTMVTLDHDGYGGGNVSHSGELSVNERRRPNNNDRNTKTGRGRPPQAREGKRTYDRRSGTGRGREVKKGGSGSHNWGSEKYDARKAEGSVTELQDNGENVTDTHVWTTEGTEDEPRLVDIDDGAEEKGQATLPRDEWKNNVEEEDNQTMTLAEFLKSKTNPDSELFKPKEIKAVDNEFIGKTARITVKDDVLVMGKGKVLRKKGNKKPEKITLDVGFRTPRPMNYNRRNGEKDRHGGIRGGRDRGNYGDGNGGEWHSHGGNILPQRTLNVMDPRAFPSL